MAQLHLLFPDREEIDSFILKNLQEHPQDITRATMDAFGLSRVAVVNHLRRLIDDGLVEATGRTRGRKYNLRNFVDENIRLVIEASTAEDREWRAHVAPLLEGLRPNVFEICHHGFTEMFNNVIEHSESQIAAVKVTRNAANTQIIVIDRGLGIFHKLQEHFDLEDPRHALLELCKGKLTSDPERHTGEGIFFTSRMFDTYAIVSGKLIFTRMRKHGQDWLDEVAEDSGVPGGGTVVSMLINNDSALTTGEVFDRFAPGSEDFGFTKTEISVHLAQFEGEKLISRSQARRLAARFERFLEVVLDFSGVKEIGPAFADEIFRVYSREHPSVNIYSYNTSIAVEGAIRRAQKELEAEE